MVVKHTGMCIGVHLLVQSDEIVRLREVVLYGLQLSLPEARSIVAPVFLWVAALIQDGSQNFVAGIPVQLIVHACSHTPHPESRAAQQRWDTSPVLTQMVWGALAAWPVICCRDMRPTERARRFCVRTGRWL